MTKQKTERKKKFSFKNLPKFVKELSAVISAIIVISGAFISVSGYISSKITESTNERLDVIDKKLHSIELDTTRTQLLTLMNHYPNNESEILKVASYYFKDLDGDWYMSELFSKWATDRGIDVSDIMAIKK